MENNKQKRQIVIKSVLVISIASLAGLYIQNAFVLIVQAYLQTFYKAHLNTELFIYRFLLYFFLFLFVSISQWILFSKVLPKNWGYASFLGAILGGLLPSVRQLIIVEQYPLMILYLRFLDGFVLVGFLSAIPQWILLKNNLVMKNYYWLIINCIGWGIVGLFINQQLSLSYVLMGRIWTVFFDWIQHYRLWNIVEIFSFIPLGVGIGLFFTQSGIRVTHEDEY